MNSQSKFSLADVILVLTALSFSFVCFLGLNFYTLGNTTQSLVVSVVIFILLTGTALGAKLLKRTSRNFKVCLAFEVVLLALFTVLLAFFSYFPFPQYFSVLSQKNEIQSELQNGISQAAKMFEEYEKYAENRITLYQKRLNSVVAAKSTQPDQYRTYEFVNTASDNTQINNKIFTIRNDLFPTNYSDTLTSLGIKEVATNWFNNASKSVSSWKALSIPNIVVNVEENSKKWLTQLINFSIHRETGEIANDFTYNLSFPDVKTRFTTHGQLTASTICMAVVVWLLMLLSWLSSDRHIKSTIFKTQNDKGEFDINIKTLK